MYELQSKLSQLENEYKQQLAELASMKPTQAVPMKLPTDGFSGTYEELLRHQMELQRELSDMEQTIAQITKESRDEVISAERERDAIMERTSEKLQSVMEQRLLLEHLQEVQVENTNAKQMNDAKIKLSTLEKDIQKEQFLIDDEIIRAEKQLVRYISKLAFLKSLGWS